LSSKSAGEFTLDMCYGGCGGIWFDATELQRVSARAAATLHTIWQLPTREDESEGPRLCPRCPKQQLELKWFSEARKVEIDQCPKCGGIWLDDGEFTHVYEEIKKRRASSAPWADAVADAVGFVRSHPGPDEGPARG